MSSPALFQQLVTPPDQTYTEDDQTESLSKTVEDISSQVSPLKVFGAQYSEFQANEFIAKLTKKDILLISLFCWPTQEPNSKGL